MVDGTCTFDIDISLHNAHHALPACTPATVTAVTFQGTDDPDIAAAQTAVNALLPASTNVCTTGQALHVAWLRGDDATLSAVTKQVALSATAEGGATDDDSLTVTRVPHGWPSHGYDYANRRASPLETVLTPENAANLSVKWRFDVRSFLDEQRRQCGQLHADGRLRHGLRNRVERHDLALRESTGELVWSHKVTLQFLSASKHRQR
jgi:hypothetical protein